MKVRVFRSAFEDLAAGREFYDRRRGGVGDYFFGSLFSEIDSLALYAGIHRMDFGFHRLLAKHFPYAFITGSSAAKRWYSECWIVGGTQNGFGTRLKRGMPNSKGRVTR